MQPILEQAIQFFHLRQWSQAETLLLMLHAQKPQEAQPLHYLGLVKYQLGELEAAENYLKLACELTPNYPEQKNNLGLIQHHRKKYFEAQQTYLNVLALKPDFVEAHFNLGNTYHKQGQFKLALDSFKQAIKIDSTFLKAYQNMGIIYQELGQMKQALRLFKQGLSHQFPNHPDVVKMMFLYQYDAEKSAQQIFELYQNWGSQFEYLTMPMVSGYQKKDELMKNGLCRIAYLSPDFRDHSALYFYQALLKDYNREFFEVFCYSLVENPDHVTNDYEREVEHWLDCSQWTDEQIAQQVVKDKISILIDPGVGHTNHHRLGVFARKPAPVQLTFYPTSTGLSRMDYRMTDQYLDPSSERHFNSEKLLYHPVSFFCFKPPENSPPVNQLPALNNGYITFGSFNHLAKHNTKLLSIWVQLLKKLPTARLVMKNIAFQSEAVQSYWYKLLSSLGIERSRLTFLSPTLTRFEHLNAYHQIDIALDTFPYQGMTTTLEALWMGVPIVSLLGVRHFSRVNLSILSNLGLENWLAENPEEYLNIAQKMSQKLKDLSELRNTLRERLKASSLCDTKTYVQELETLYRSTQIK